VDEKEMTASEAYALRVGRTAALTFVRAMLDHVFRFKLLVVVHE
jgi:hypothetical protein